MVNSVLWGSSVLGAASLLLLYSTAAWGRDGAKLQNYRMIFDGASEAVVAASCSTSSTGALDVFTISPPSEKHLIGDGLSCRFEQRGGTGIVRIAVLHRAGVALVTMAGAGNPTILAVR